MWWWWWWWFLWLSGEWETYEPRQGLACQQQQQQQQQQTRNSNRRTNLANAEPIVLAGEMAHVAREILGRNAWDLQAVRNAGFDTGQLDPRPVAGVFSGDGAVLLYAAEPQSTSVRHRSGFMKCISFFAKTTIGLFYIFLELC